MKSLLIAFTVLAALETAGCHRSPQERAAQFLHRGKELMDRKDYARAALAFKNAVQLLPKDAEPAYELGLAYLGQGNLNLAVATLFRANKLDSKHLATQIKIAELMAQSGDQSLVKEGEKRMRELLESTPSNTDALNVLALSELELGQFQDAEVHLRGALERLPNNLASVRVLASLYLNRHDYESAEQVLKKAFAAAPQSDIAVGLGQLYILSERLLEAKAAFQTALEISPGDGSALLGLAAVESRLGNKGATEQIYRKLAELPDHRYQHLHAAYLFADGRRDEALQELEKLAKKAPGDRAPRSRLIAAYMATGRTDTAKSILDAALQTNPKDTDALQQRGRFLLGVGKTQEAENDLNQVLHFRPDSAEAHYLLALVHESHGVPARQTAELNEALHYDPTLLPARVALAQLLTVSGSPSAALDVLNSVPKEQAHTLVLILERNLANFVAGNQKGFREGVAEALRVAQIPDTLLQNAVVKLIDRDYAKARASADEALKQDPESVRALKTIAYCYTAQNRPKEASRFLTEYGTQTKSAAVAQFIGQWLWSDGDHTEGRAAWIRAASLDSQFLPADLALAQADMAEGRTSDAAVTLTHVLANDAGKFPGHMLFAALETQEGNFEGAIEHYRKALEIRPHDVEVLNNLAYVLADKADQPDDALAYAQQAVEALPENPDAVGTLGWVLYRKGLYEDAQRHLQRAADQDRQSTNPNAVIRKYHLAMTYLKLGDRKKGTEILLRALQQNPYLPEAAIAQATLR